MRYQRMAVLTAVTLLANCGDSTGPDGHGSNRSESFEWSGQIALDARVQIRNISGNVRARPASDGMVHVRARKEGSNDSPSTVRIDVLETAQGVTICAIYPDVPGQPANECQPGMAGQLSSRNNDVSVTFDVDIPAGRAFIGGTIGGEVSATGLSGDVTARTLAGDIEISTSALAEATTISGDINASMGQAVWSRDISFTTLDGNITVRVPVDANADVHGSARAGSISTDFPLSITRLGDWHQLRGRLGSGGRKLNITTNAGNIALLSTHSTIATRTHQGTVRVP